MSKHFLCILVSYSTLITTDRSIYRSGESILWSGYLFGTLDYAPAVNLEALGQLEVKAPSGDVLHSGSFYPNADLPSVLGGSIPVQDNWKGGQYTLRVTVPGASPAERKFEIRAFRAPRLTMVLEFMKRGYGAGESVTAFLTARRAEGGIPFGAAVRAYATLDGQQFWSTSTPLNLDAAGKTVVAFSLPTEIATGSRVLGDK
jgi:uncharacterized protein YfaS (alpha-2-macroglobulin family)